MPRSDEKSTTLRRLGLAWLAYCPGGCVPGFFLADENDFTAFHVRQGTALTTLWLACLLIGFLSKAVALFFAWILGVLMIAGMIAVLQGRRCMLPGVASLAGLEPDDSV